jgi:hypothetical protein
MEQRAKAYVVVVTAVLMSLALGLVDLPAQSPGPSRPSRQSTLREIQQYAKRHADNDSPMATSLVVDLYKDNSVGLTQKQIAQIYEEEYVRTRSKETLWSQLQPKVGWIAAVIFGILLIFRDLLKDWSSALLKALGDTLYARLAGRRLLRLVALRRYRRAIVEKYRELRIPFRPNRPLRMREVYVPLRLAGDAGLGRDVRIDASRALASYRRLMIKGPPGSGKSMLLRQIILSYAEDRLDALPDRPIPILLDLHRLNDDSSLSLEEHLVLELGRNGFPQSGRFVARNLERGALMLLFDGLDEVGSAIRPAVAKQIVDFLAKYRRCRFLSTCRTAIYREEFASSVEQTLEVDEFSDFQIRRFLSSWQSSMPQGKSVEQLIRTLSDRPRIMALARNPLLLTIIAYLYSDTNFQLPHSRSEFYETSTDVLLNQWHQEHNRFKARDKRLVLQQVALQLQDGQLGQDRRTAEFKAVLANARLILPELGLSTESVDDLLDEIVERSGLLLAIDGGERYAFAHLTLQEFFAAEALRNNPDQILERFRRDPDAWREAIRLWCGLYPDSTEVVRAIREIEPITAFECLADVQRIDPDYAANLADSFKKLLGSHEDQSSIIDAFASVASDSRERGNDTFEFLAETLRSPSPARRLAAAEALSRTNLPRAAEILADRAEQHPDLRPALVRLGDLAVPALLAKANTAEWKAALDDLVAIGTPSAATGMVPLLWHGNDALAQSAAWRLGSLLRREEIEEALRDLDPVRLGREESGTLGWVWAPFHEPAGSSLPAVTGRIAYLLCRFWPSEDLELDPRLVLALCTERASGFAAKNLTAKPLSPAAREFHLEFDLQSHEKIPGVSQYLSAEMDRLKGEPRRRFVSKLLRAGGADDQLPDLLSSVDESLATEIVKRLIRGPAPRRADWLKIFEPLEYEFRKGWSFRSCIALFAGLTLATFASILIFQGEFQVDDLSSWLAFGGMLELGFLWLLLAVSMTDAETNPSELEAVPLGAILGILSPIVTLAVVLGVLIQVARRRPSGATWTGAGLFIAFFLLGPWAGVLLGAPFAAIGYFVSIALLQVVPGFVVALFWVAVLGAEVTLWMIGRRAHRASQNPLKDLLLPSDGRRKAAGRIFPFNLLVRGRRLASFRRRPPLEA